MLTVALVGADGAGKTSVAHMLLQSFPVPMKYLYMGTSILSSNFALPSSRLILYLKKRAYRRAMPRETSSPHGIIATHHFEYQSVKRGKIAATASLLNRLAEEWYRQLISWTYQLRGYVVLYDRHYIFEYAPDSREARKPEERLSERVHLWCLRTFYPRPDLVVFLDAPPEVLMRRKLEWTLERLQKHRDGLIEQGSQARNFLRIDATQPLEQVYAEVSAYLARFLVPKTGSV